MSAIRAIFHDHFIRQIYATIRDTSAVIVAGAVQVAVESTGGRAGVEVCSDLPDYRYNLSGLLHLLLHGTDKFLIDLNSIDIQVWIVSAEQTF